MSWGERDDGTTWLCCRFPVVLWTEEDAAILPPDTTSEAGPAPFYLDPVDQPGAFRDIFKTWGRRVAGELCSRGFPMSTAVKLHMPEETRGLFHVLNGGGA